MFLNICRSSIQNSNEVISNPLDMYRSVKMESNSSSNTGTDFFSRLNGEVKVNVMSVLKIKNSFQ